MEKEVSEAERRVSIKKNYSKKIELLLDKDVDDRELYSVIRSFFSEFLKLDYAFTYEELSQELNKIFIKQALKSKIDRLLEDLTVLEYTSGFELSQSEKKKILSDFKDMVDELIIDFESKEELGFFEKLFGKKSLKPQLNSNDTGLLGNVSQISQKNIPTSDASKSELISAQSVAGDLAVSDIKLSKIEELKRDNTSNSRDFDFQSVREKNIDLLSELNTATIAGSLSSEPNSKFIEKDISEKKKFDLEFSKLTVPELDLSSIDLSRNDSKQSQKNFSNSRSKDNVFFYQNDEMSNNSKSALNSRLNNNDRHVKNSVSNSNTQLSVQRSKSSPIQTSDNLSDKYLEVENYDQDIIKIKTYIEECYSEKLSGRLDDAKKKYMHALEFYNTLPYEKQTKLYIELYDLYARLR